jgi:hypothetical protein
MKWLVLIALLFSGILSVIYGEFRAVESKAVEEISLILEEPEYEWVRPSTQGTELCLTGSDFIKHQMFMEGLKHEAEK